MTFRSFAVVAFSVLSFAAGCSAEATEAAAASSSDVVAERPLLSQTIVKGPLAAGTSKVAYEPYDKTKIDGVPYLAWELAAPSAASLTVEVAGDFPSTPDVLLVDAGFNVVGQARGTATNLGDKATLAVDASAGAKFILVRDMEWVRPMDFEISVSE